MIWNLTGGHWGRRGRRGRRRRSAIFWSGQFVEESLRSSFGLHTIKVKYFSHDRK